MSAEDCDATVDLTQENSSVQEPLGRKRRLKHVVDQNTRVSVVNWMIEERKKSGMSKLMVTIPRNYQRR